MTGSLPGYARTWLGIRARVPVTTMRDTLVKLDPIEVRGLLHGQTKAAHLRGDLKAVGLPLNVLAIDGKTTALKTFDRRFVQRRRIIEGRKDGMARTLTCSLVSSRSKFCIDANPIPASTNEMGHFKNAINELLEIYKDMNLFDIISADAGLCSQEHGQFVVDKGLHYLFALKDPRSHLQKAAVKTLGPTSAEQCKAMTTDRLGKKFTVIRRLYQSSELAGRYGWQSLETVSRIESVKIDNESGEPVFREDRYFLSDLPSHSLTPREWLKLIRSHWMVENECHGTLDVTFKEDTCPWINANGDGFLVVLILRRIALNIQSLFRSSKKNHFKRGKSLIKLAWKKILRWTYLAVLGIVENDVLNPVKGSVPDITLV